MKSEPLRAVLDAVALDPAGDHSLQALAERANFSVRHPSRLFEAQVGLTLGAYVERVRVEAARAMLESGTRGCPWWPSAPASGRPRRCAGRSCGSWA